MILFIVSALMVVVALGVGIYLAVKFIKSAIPPLPFNRLYKRILIVIAVFALAFTSMMISIYLWNKIKPNGYELTAAIIGGLFTLLFMLPNVHIALAIILPILATYVINSIMGAIYYFLPDLKDGNGLVLSMRHKKTLPSLTTSISSPFFMRITCKIWCSSSLEK